MSWQQEVKAAHQQRMRLATSGELERLRERLKDMFLPFSILELAETIGALQERMRREQEKNWRHP